MTTPDFILTPQPLEPVDRDSTFPFERFWAKVDKKYVDPNQCWEWTEQSRDKRGYGQFWLDGKTRRAHRVAWEFKYGPIEDGLVLLHKCDNPPCVRVDPSGPIGDDHFYLGTVAENNTDRDAKNRGVKLIGERNGASLIDSEIVRMIRVMTGTEKKSYAEVSRITGVSPSNVARIAKRETWTHVE